MICFINVRRMSYWCGRFSRIMVTFHKTNKQKSFLEEICVNAAQCGFFPLPLSIFPFKSRHSGSLVNADAGLVFFHSRCVISFPPPQQRKVT